MKEVTKSRALCCGVVGLLIATAVTSASAPASAQQTVAGAEPTPATKIAKPVAAATPKQVKTTAAPAAAPVTVAQVNTQSAAGTPMPAESVVPGPPALTTNTTTVNVATAPAMLACIPDCRAGYVCREGECVSGCNPICGESEMCNAKRECVPRTSENEPYPYDKTRFGIGGAFGVGTSSDGTSTPFGGVIGVAFPLGGHWYSREDIVVTYATTSIDDHYYVGSSVNQTAPTTVVDQSYLLVALRATAGYQFNSVVSARLGLFAGSLTLNTQHGFCGVGYVERDDTSFAIGGTGALGFAIKHADLSAVVDGYSANTQQLCSVVANPYGGGFGAYGQPAALVPERHIAAQVLAQATFLF